MRPRPLRLSAVLFIAACFSVALSAQSLSAQSRSTQATDSQDLIRFDIQPPRQLLPPLVMLLR